MPMPWFFLFMSTITLMVLYVIMIYFNFTPMSGSLSDKSTTMKFMWKW